VSGPQGPVPDLRRYIFDVWVLDVRGTHVTVFTSHPVDADAGDIAQMQQLLHSIRFELTN
jgi:hypothetical protein